MPSRLDLAKADRRAFFQELTRDYLRKHSPGPRIASFLKEILPGGAIVAGYRAKSDEINLHSLYAGKDQAWVFPKVLGGELLFLRPLTPNAFVKGAFGIEEPDPMQSEEVAFQDIAAVLVPGVAFDRDGFRLGRGKGFYDRALAGFNGLKIGVAAQVQVASEALPREPHDVQMDLLVTDDYVLRFFNS